MIKLTLLAIFAFSCASYATEQDQIVLDGGVGVAHSADHGLSETKMLTLGIQETLWGALKDRAVVGAWLDNSGNGKSNSALASGQIGFEVDRDGLIAGVFTGPCVISQTDVLLGGNLQFMDDFHLGIEAKDHSYIGLMYRHISSAGISTPNIGRDVVGIELRF